MCVRRTLWLLSEAIYVYLQLGSTYASQNAASDNMSSIMCSSAISSPELGSLLFYAFNAAFFSARFTHCTFLRDRAVAILTCS